MRPQFPIVKSKTVRFLLLMALALLILLLVTSCDQVPSANTASYVSETVSPLHSVNPLVSDPPVSEMPTSEPTPTIQVTQSPRTFSPVSYRPAGDRSREPLARDSEMEMLELHGEDASFPAIYAPYLHMTDVSQEWLDEIARNTAERMWGTARSTMGDGYESPVTDTEYGNFTARILTPWNGLIYQAGWWEDTEQTPFFLDDHVRLNEAEAKLLADAFLEKLGWKAFATGNPKVTGNALAESDPLPDTGQTINVYWSEMLPDQDLRTSSVRVDILNGQIAHISINISQYEIVEKEDPVFLLSAEEALYCLNYARSMIHDKDNPIMQYPYLHSYEPAYRYDFGRDSGDYIPTWVFYMSADKDKTEYMQTEIYVAADSGIVETGTNAGNMPSPYR